jgi:chemotaxis protein methyltransferase CheR
MEQRVFEKFKTLIYEKSGITLGPQKVALVSARVGKRMRTLGLAEHGDYLQRLYDDTTGTELVQLLDAISTNVTSFFRESAHFDFLGEALAQWRGQGQRRFRIWSAASSTGEEPYTIAMTALEALKEPAIDLKILATDISTRVLEVCRRGQYAHARVEPVPPALLHKYFQKQQNGHDPVYEVTEELKRLVKFGRLNLSTPPFPMTGPLDVVFCRNVMIYFDEAVRRRLVGEVERLLKPGGFFMIGHSESLTGLTNRFRIIKPSVYRKI